MPTHFFKRQTTSAGEMLDCHGVKLTKQQCVMLLQEFSIKAGALNFDQKYQDFITEYSNGSKWLERGINQRLSPLKNKFSEFFKVLLPLDSEHSSTDVNFAEVERALIAIDNEIKNLFDKYSFFITQLQTQLIAFISKKIKTPNLIATIPTLFSDQSIKSFIACKIANIYHSGFLAQVISNTDEIQDNRVLDATIQNILSKRSVSLNFIDQCAEELLYITSLKQEFLYDVVSHEVLHLADVSNEKLSTMAQTWLSRDARTEEQQWQLVLQLLAIVSTLYQKITSQELSDKDLAMILLALKVPSTVLSWQRHELNATVLFIYLAMCGLQKNVVYIENTASDFIIGKNYSFLQILGLTYEVIHAKLSMLLPRFSPDHQARTFYIDLSVMDVDAESLKNYLQQALRNIKALALQPFGAWHTVFLSHQLYDAQEMPGEGFLDEEEASLKGFISPLRLKQGKPSVSIGLQQLLQYYLQTIESEWIRYIEHCAPFDNLKQVDNAIVVFQEQKLVPLWQSLEHQYKPYITQLLSKKTSLLQAQNTYIWNGLKLPIFLRWDQTSVAHIYQATIGKNRASTHLYYDSAYLLPREKQILIQRYIKQQFVRLHHLCPSVERCAPREYREQLRHFIVYLSAHVSSDKPFYFPNHYTAMMICVDLYECTKSFLSGHNDDLELQISGLRLKINHHPLGFFSLSLKEQLETQFLSFYYRWLERPMVKQSADTIYHLVNQLNAAPQDVNQCKQLIQLLYEQEHHLAQIGWYFSLLRFFGIKNTYDLLRKSIQLLEEMVALGQIALDVHEEAKADAQTAPVLRDMNALLQNVSIRPPDDEAWKQVLLNIKKIQTTSSGMGMWYELRDYVLHQQQKFVRIERNYFFGTKHIDPMDELLRKINTVLERVPISSLNRLDSIYLKQKAKQLSSSDSNIYIQAHYLGQQYFDIWTSSISHQTVKDPFKYFEALNQIIQINSVPILRSNSSSPGFARISFTGRTLKRTSSDHIVLKRHPNISHSEKIDTCLSSELAFVKRVYSKSALFHFIHHHDEHSVEGQHASSLMFV